MELALELRKLLGDEIIADDPEVLAAHSGDKWFAARQPEVVVFAKSTNDVSKLLQFASREKIPVTARGGGFGYVGGCVPAQGGIALSLMRMNRIKEIGFADAVAIVEPGVFTAELKAAVRAQKLFYPPDPASMKDCTIGGNVATNAGGPRCLKYGVTRNYVIGLEVVLANSDVRARHYLLPSLPPAKPLKQCRRSSRRDSSHLHWRSPIISHWKRRDAMLAK